MRVHKTPWIRRLGTIVGIAPLLASALAAPAKADPIADKKAEAARIENQVEAQGERVSMLAEQLNQARIAAQNVEAALAQSQVEVAGTDALVAAARSRLRAQAVATYVKGGHLSSLQLLVGGNESTLAIRKSYMKAITGQERAALDNLAAAREQQDAKRAALENARKSARAALAKVDANQRSAAAAEAAAEATLAKVKGDLAGLVAAEAQRRAEEAARRAQADLAARQARQAADRAARPAPTLGPAPAASSGAGAAVAEAQRQLGKPYQYGAAGPNSFDCSGLTMWSWRAGGVSLPHSAAAQYSAIRHVAVSDLVPGDLVFYGSPIHHVGMYVGNGQMIEASRTGVPVRYSSIYRSDLVGAGRPG
ncbi:MAG TPA: NlpC/P60 family protein [Acidimicrobiales bacterium]|nr:NlpC/P60 family protein [Acidimicrobiales bacterium]